jgi:hypothetical protein
VPRPLLSRAFVLVVELRGLEPRTCCLQSSRSTNLSYSPMEMASELR